MHTDSLSTASISIRAGATLTVADATAGICTLGGSAIDASAWNVSTIRSAVAEASTNSNRFTSTFQFQANSSATNTANVEQGAAFFRAIHNDKTATVTPNVVGFDALGQIPAGNTQGAIWGGVCRTQIDATGDGWAIGLEIDSTNSGSDVNDHQDSATPHVKTGLWMASFGSFPSSWMIDSVVTGPGWHNGISVRNIVAGGIGLELPNNIGLYWRNAANNADLKILNLDGSNNAVLNVPSGSSIFFQVNGAGIGNVSGTGWNLTGGFNSPTGTFTAAAPTVSAGKVGLGSTHATTVGAAGGATALPATPLGYIIANVDGTQVKIPYYNN